MCHFLKLTAIISLYRSKPDIPIYLQHYIYIYIVFILLYTNFKCKVKCNDGNFPCTSKHATNIAH